MPSAPGGPGDGLLGLSPLWLPWARSCLQGFWKTAERGLPPSRVSQEISVSCLDLVGQLGNNGPLSSMEQPASQVSRSALTSCSAAYPRSIPPPTPALDTWPQRTDFVLNTGMCPSGGGRGLRFVSWPHRRVRLHS